MSNLIVAKLILLDQGVFIKGPVPSLCNYPEKSEKKKSQNQLLSRKVAKNAVLEKIITLCFDFNRLIGLKQKVLSRVSIFEI